MKTLPKNADENLLVGIETGDDAAVYRIDEKRSIVQTLDFFAPNVDEPYLFGKIAATNALSDIFAMGARVLTALNIVCFPENRDMNLLSEILRGGAEKVLEAGGVLCGGHTVSDDLKYGLSVTGIVDTERLIRNNTCVPGDKIVLTKPLGTGIALAAKRAGECSEAAYSEATLLMQTLNKYAAETALKYDVHAMTDVTGFGFLGHLCEMAGDSSFNVNFRKIPYITGVYDYAKSLLTTSLGQKNRKYFEEHIYMENVPEPLAEIMSDPQTSGGLLISLPEADAKALVTELNTSGCAACVVADTVPAFSNGKKIAVTGGF